MKIGVLSDSHGSVKWFEKALNCLRDCDVVIHLGDVLYHGPRNPLPEDYRPTKLVEIINGFSQSKLIFVRGNCDADVDLIVLKHDVSHRFRNFKVGLLQIGMIHGDQFSSKRELMDFSRKFNLRILLYGHTHRKFFEFNEGVLLFNPGSISLPKDDSKSIGILNVEDRKVEALFYIMEKDQTIPAGAYDFSVYL